jgi:hypothetical protein
VRSHRSQNRELGNNLRRIEVAYRVCGLPFPGGYDRHPTLSEHVQFSPRTLYDHVAVIRMMGRISRYSDHELAAQVLQQLQDKLHERSAARGITVDQADWLLFDDQRSSPTKVRLELGPECRDAENDGEGRPADRAKSAKPGHGRLLRLRAIQRDRVDRAVKFREEENLTANEIAERLRITVDTLNKSFDDLEVRRPWG